MPMGPPLAVDGPLPVPPSYGLLSVAQLVEESDPHWLVGVHVYGYPADVPFTWDPCSAGSMRPKPEGEPSPTPLFGPFVVGLPIKCTSSGIDPDTFQNRALLAFQAKEGYGVEVEFAQGLQVPLNPHLTDGNHTLTEVGATAVSAAVGLAALEQAIGETAAGGVIHATPAVASMWESNGALEVRGNRLVTKSGGTPVSRGGGYIGADPAGLSAAGVGRSWCYATGPVQYRRSEVILNPPTLAEALDRDVNDVIYRAERGYVVDWDTALQAAVLIDWTP